MKIITNCKKITLRKCIISKQMLPKKELIRIVKTLNGEIIIDSTGKINGRGTYLQPTLKIYEKSKKSNTLERALKAKLNNHFYEMLYNEINKYLK